MGSFPDTYNVSQYRPRCGAAIFVWQQIDCCSKLQDSDVQRCARFVKTDAKSAGSRGGLRRAEVTVC